MAPDKFEEMLVENMRFNENEKVTLPQRETILDALNGLELMTVGLGDRFFCNSFLAESVRLLINSVFLYEEGYFDCAFYSIRQATETVNNMLYIANKGKSELIKWNDKNYFPMNARIVKQLSEVDAFYSEVKDAIPNFFSAHENLMKKSHKIIHKQGFDTFYLIRKNPAYGAKFCKEDEVALFSDFLTKTICMLIILYIIVDPVSLVLSDEDLSMRFNFDPMEEPANVEYLQEHLGTDVVTKIKRTSYFTTFSSFFETKEKMLPATFNVVRNHAFDLDCLEEIQSQRHLLNIYEKLILDLLLANIKFTQIYPECYLSGYITSIQSKFQRMEWSSTEYEQYLSITESFNLSYHTIFRSIVNGPRSNWLLDHNEPFSDTDIEKVREIFFRYSKIFEGF